MLFNKYVYHPFISCREETSYNSENHYLYLYLCLNQLVNNLKIYKMIILDDGNLVPSPNNNLYHASIVEKHSLIIPDTSYIQQLGLSTKVIAHTDKGNKIEILKFHLNTISFYLIDNNKAPIQLFPNNELCSERSDKIGLKPNSFIPLYNCHGCTFLDGEFWINPYIFENDASGRNVNKKNIEILLDDEYTKVNENEIWDIAVFKNNNNNIVHSIRIKEGKIISKYDLFYESTHNLINEIELERYGGVENVNIDYFKKNNY